MVRDDSHRRLILVTGATGYVGGRLTTELERRGERVRCMARRPEHLAGRVAPTTEVVAGDVTRPESLIPAMRGVDTAYYLIHSMGGEGSFEEAERKAAHAFAVAARLMGVRRIVYLGGLGEGEGLSSHLRSRQRVGQILRHGRVPALELRASIILGSGSLSFEMIRDLVEKLPVMVTPRWVSTQAQPIAIEDVVAYLVAALDAALPASRVVQIGGADRGSYADIMREYARQRGLTRRMVPVPVLTPWLSGLWLGLVTPLRAQVGRKLMSSLPNETVVTDRSAADLFPRIQPRGLADAIARALEYEDGEFARTRWSDAVSSSGPAPSYGGVRFGSRVVDSRETRVDARPDVVFGALSRLGGRRGYFYADALWKLRGVVDELVGGPGLRRGRRDPESLIAGDVVDWWRVEEVVPDRRLRLRAEMKLPGRAWLQFDLEPDGDGTLVRQTAIFDPIGLAGLAYWYGIYPLHVPVFRGMVQGLARAAEEGAAAGPDRAPRANPVGRAA